jgi:uncharacterized membrane-anchored protein YitT (DUF2179 family)/predicted metal-dependent HD superfamily phosphohydrolase
MNYDQVYAFLIDKLEIGLPYYTSYHDLAHTKSVIEAVTFIGTKEGATEEDIILLKTAALFHDAGFLQSHQDHEALSCKLAQKYLPAYGYTGVQIEQICTMIRATGLPQSASDRLSEILCDADLYYFGDEAYAVKAEKLYQEFLHNGKIKNPIDWTKQQLDFLSSHQYYTNTAKETRNVGKEKNLAQLKASLELLEKHKKSASPLNLLKDACYVLAGVIISGIALKCFLVPNHFFDGGVTGLSLLIHEIYGVNLALVIILLNIPFVIAGFFTVGKSFAIRTLISVVLLGVCLVVLPSFALTTDKLLISLFGGAFLGIGVGLVMRAGAAVDGIEVLALYTLRRTSFTITEIILGINILIFTIAAFQFGVESALYSILTYFTASKSIDYVVEGLQAHTGVTIISGKSEVIKHQLVNNLGRGITVYKGERGFLPGAFEESTSCDIIFTVITRMELRKLKNLIHQVDPQAFIYANTIKEASGGILKRRHRH